ncbi:MAG: HupE/UreJ family protein, partial [Gammaproteobacteria bacterium]
IEAIIALSIIFLVVEILKNNRDSLIWRHPIIVASGFGLLHGLGFASALNDIGLPQLHQVQALLFFNLGVEIGQIIFILVLILAKTFLFDLSGIKTLFQFHSGLKTAFIYAVGIICSYWFIERSLTALI